MPTVYSPTIPTYVPIATVTLSSPDAEVVFSNIPSDYKDLSLVYTGTNATGLAGVRVRINGIVTQSYRNLLLDAGPGGLGGSKNFETSMNVGVSSNIKSATTIEFIDYALSGKRKAVLGRGSESNYMRSAAGIWLGTDPITSITVLTGASGYDFQPGSTFSLFGIHG